MNNNIPRFCALPEPHIPKLQMPSSRWIPQAGQGFLQRWTELQAGGLAVLWMAVSRAVSLLRRKLFLQARSSLGMRSAEQQAGFAPRCLGCECPAPVPAPSLSPSGLLLSASTFPQQQEHEIRYLVFKELNGETFSVHSCSAFNLFLQSRYISNLELERVASG